MSAQNGQIDTSAANLAMVLKIINLLKILRFSKFPSKIFSKFWTFPSLYLHLHWHRIQNLVRIYSSKVFFWSIIMVWELRKVGFEIWDCRWECETLIVIPKIVNFWVEAWKKLKNASIKCFTCCLSIWWSLNEVPEDDEGIKETQLSEKYLEYL